jgi:CheY-like chemotaxis protein
VLSGLIVYVEDDEDDVLLMRDALNQAKHSGSFVHLSTVTAAKAYFDLAEARGESPVLILVDLHLGPHSGNDVIRYVRAKPIFNKAPIVSISGAYVYEDHDDAYQTGANLFMVKPHQLNGWTEMMFKLRDYFPRNQ